MKVVLLAGGLGTRLSEETHLRPKPMVEVGGNPLLWHVMQIYAHYGFDDFVIACGYKSDVIKHYFSNLHLLSSSCVFSTKSGHHRLITSNAPEWDVACVDTGLDTLTAGRLLALKPMLKDATFMVTYGDGVGNIDIPKLLDFHRSHGRLATVTAVRPKARFGMLSLEDNKVVSFSEKNQLNEGWVNGGFFVFEPGFFDYLTQNEPLEQTPLVNASKDGELMAYFHDDFWQPVDTLREKSYLEELWQQGDAPWKVWKDSENQQLFETETL